MATELTYEEACRLVDLVQGDGSAARWEAAWAEWGAEATTEDMVSVLRSSGWKDISAAKVKVTESASGGINGYVGEFPVSYTDPVNSNNVVKGTARVPINTTAEVIEERSVMSAKVGLREAGNFAIGSVVPAVAAAGIGITLGKAIDNTLYDLAPDFWDSHNMSSLDPETWNSITSDYDGVAGTLFDLVFGLDSDGNTQAYINEDAFAYIARWMSEQGVFTQAGYSVEENPDTTNIPISADVDFPIPAGVGTGGVFAQEGYTVATSYQSSSNTASVLMLSDYGTGSMTNRRSYTIIEASDSNFSNTSQTLIDGRPSGSPSTSTALTGTRKNETVYYTAINGTTTDESRYPLADTFVDGHYSNTGRLSNSDIISIAWLLTYSLTAGVTIPGISDQPNANLPSTTGWSDVPSTKQSLQQQYPQLWDGAKHNDYVDENGQNKSTTLIPINLPNVRNPIDSKPTSGDRSQDEPLIDPSTATEDLLKTITDLITGITSPNPPITGTGDSPVVPVPVGRASSLWKIYNPTQAQVDSFGAWLWDSSFVEQIKKLFNDPMQAIIGIHKVFATPSIGGTATIKVGYLDSQVPSDWVDNQYTTINCGTVNLSEYFGNVFDYSPYTKVSIYLPFIGIVDLDVADIMRSEITVIYHVDVLTGACLADVKVSRDLATAVLYQYAGSAIVSYPVSSGNYMGMVAGVLSVASGIAGTVLSGGALAPALIGGAVGASHLHTDVSKSGGFSGSAGAMGGKIPYLIISRPQTAMADNYGHFTGRPANSHVILRNCNGMTRVKTVYVGNMNATDEEKDMIEAQLKAGILI